MYSSDHISVFTSQSHVFLGRYARRSWLATQDLYPTAIPNPFLCCRYPQKSSQSGTCFQSLHGTRSSYMAQFWPVGHKCKSDKCGTVLERFLSSSKNCVLLSVLSLYYGMGLFLQPGPLLSHGKHPDEFWLDHVK